MEVIELPLELLHEAPWNANQMDPAMRDRLRESIRYYGLVENLVVRRGGDGTYEVLGGNQRLQVLQELGRTTAPCVVVSLEDAPAKLLSQALNRIQGEDDLGLRAELLREVLAGIPQAQVMALLPETPQSLGAARDLGQQTLDQYLQVWEEARGARLHHYTFQLTTVQIEVVEKALAKLLPLAKAAQEDSPSVRGTALYLLCHSYLEKEQQL
jgi:ParB family chromosome partitioning protein